MTQPTRSAPRNDAKYTSADAFRNELAAIEAKMADNPRSLTDADLATLERLKKLQELRKFGNSTTKARASAIAIAFVCVLIVATALAFIIPRDTVALRFEAREITFVLDSAANVTREAALLNVSTGSLRGLVAPNVGGKAEALIPISTLRLDAGSNARITLAPLVVQAGATVTLVREPGSLGAISVRIEDSTSRVAATVLGVFRLAAENGVVRLDYPRAERITGLSRGGSVDLTLVLRDPAQQFFAAPIAVREMRTFRLEPDLNAGSGSRAGRAVSTLLSATLQFAKMEGVERAVHPTEVLRLEGIHGAHLRRLAPTRDGFEAEFVGSVSDVVIGRRSAMPSLFDVARKQHTLASIWGALGALFVVGTGLLRWWRNPS